MKGKELILIHGWAADSTVWGNTGEFLSDKHRVHSVDLPPMIDMFSYRDAVLNLIREKRIGQAYLIGWSLGSLVSLQVVQAIPEKIGGLVLVAGTGKFTKGEAYDAGLSLQAVIDMKSRFIQNSELTTREFFAQMFSQEEIRMGLDKKITTEILGNLRRWGAQEALSGLDYLLKCDMLMDLSQILHPTLIVHGNRDRICPFKGAEYLHEQIPNSLLLTVQAAGHIPFLTNPSFFHEHLREWLAS